MQPFDLPRCIISKEAERKIKLADKKMLFENAVEEYSDMVTGLCLLRLGNRQDAEDCYQNVFLKLYKKSGMLERSAEYIKAWLIRVTLNECKNHCRFRNRHETVPLEFVDTFYEDESDRHVIEQVMSMKEIYRDVIYLHYYCGYSVEELARLLKCSENTVKSRLRRGRDMLRTELGEEETL